MKKQCTKLLIGYKAYLKAEWKILEKSSIISICVLFAMSILIMLSPWNIDFVARLIYGISLWIYIICVRYTISKPIKFIVFKNWSEHSKKSSLSTKLNLIFSLSNFKFFSILWLVYTTLVLFVFLYFPLVISASWNIAYVLFTLSLSIVRRAVVCFYFGKIFFSKHTMFEIVEWFLILVSFNIICVHLIALLDLFIINSEKDVYIKSKVEQKPENSTDTVVNNNNNIIINSEKDVYIKSKVEQKPENSTDTVVNNNNIMKKTIKTPLEKLFGSKKVNPLQDSLHVVINPAKIHVLKQHPCVQLSGGKSVFLTDEMLNSRILKESIKHLNKSTTYQNATHNASTLALHGSVTRYSNIEDILDEFDSNSTVYYSHSNRNIDDDLNSHLNEFSLNRNQQPRNNGTPRDIYADFNRHLNVFSLNRNQQPTNNAILRNIANTFNNYVSVYPLNSNQQPTNNATLQNIANNSNNYVSVYPLNSNQQPANNATLQNIANNSNNYVSVYPLNSNQQPTNNATLQNTAFEQTIRSIQVPRDRSHVVYSNDVVTDWLVPFRRNNVNDVSIYRDMDNSTNHLVMGDLDCWALDPTIPPNPRFIRIQQVSSILDAGDRALLIRYFYDLLVRYNDMVGSIAEAPVRTFDLALVRLLVYSNANLASFSNLRYVYDYSTQVHYDAIYIQQIKDLVDGFTRSQ